MDVARVVGCWLETADEALDAPLDAPLEAAGAELLLEEDELEPDSPPMPFTAAQVPVNDPESSVTEYLFVTSAAGPGLGN
jgi:hypothetical protein